MIYIETLPLGRSDHQSVRASDGKGTRQLRAELNARISTTSVEKVNEVDDHGSLADEHLLPRTHELDDIAFQWIDPQFIE